MIGIDGASRRLVSFFSGGELALCLFEFRRELGLLLGRVARLVAERGESGLATRNLGLRGGYFFGKKSQQPEEKWPKRQKEEKSETVVG